MRPDGDGPLELVADPLGELAAGAREALLELVVVEQPERGDEAATNPLERLVAADLAPLAQRDQRGREARRLELSGERSRLGNRSRSMRSSEGKRRFR